MYHFPDFSLAIPLIGSDVVLIIFEVHLFFSEIFDFSLIGFDLSASIVLHLFYFVLEFEDGASGDFQLMGYFTQLGIFDP